MFNSGNYKLLQYLIVILLIFIIYLLFTQRIQINIPTTRESFQDLKFNYIDNNNDSTLVTLNMDNNLDQNNDREENDKINQKNKELNLKKVNKNLYLKYKQNVYTKLLQLTKDAMEELGIPCFLSSGTCLGYFRENKFIDHDYDIDIGIMVKDYTPQVIQKMEEKGFIHYRTLGDLETGMELSFRYPGTAIGKQAKVDIFLHYPEDENKFICWYSYKYPEFTEKIKYRVNNFNLKKVEFMGVPIYVPNPTLDYITQHYGEDWMVPRRAGFDYFYATSPKSIVRE